MSGLFHTESDGRTVWVHRGDETVARFGVYGIDIHNTIDAYLDGAPLCYYCTFDKTTREDWFTFVDKVKEFYGFAVDAHHMPVRFQETSP